MVASTLLTLWALGAVVYGLFLAAGLSSVRKDAEAEAKLSLYEADLGWHVFLGVIVVFWPVTFVWIHVATRIAKKKAGVKKE